MSYTHPECHFEIALGWFIQNKMETDESTAVQLSGEPMVRQSRSRCLVAEDPCFPTVGSFGILSWSKHFLQLLDMDL